MVWVPDHIVQRNDTHMTTAFTGRLQLTGKKRGFTPVKRGLGLYAIAGGC